MKATSIMATIWIIVSSFTSHYKQIIAAASIISPMATSAQFYTEYRGPYKAAFYPGNWSEKDLYVVRDEGDGLDAEYRFNIPIKIAPLATPHNDGSPTNFVWLGSDTLLKLSPVSTLSLAATQLTGVSITSSGATTITGLWPNISVNTPTVQGNITPTITALGSATVISSGNTFTVNTPIPVNYTAGNRMTISGTSPNFTVAVTKKQELFTVTTSTAGIATVTYGSTYSVAPNVQYNLGLGAGNKETIIPQTSTTTGCTFLVQLRSDVLGLLPSYAPVSGREVNILINEK